MNRNGVMQRWIRGFLAGLVWSAVCLLGLTGVYGEEAEPVLRDPFWPIGYEPPRRGDTDVMEDDRVAVEVEWPDMPVIGQSRAPDGTYRVLIRGVGVVSVGETVSVEHEGHWFHWRITAIDGRRVRSVRLGVSTEAWPDWLRRQPASDPSG